MVLRVHVFHFTSVCVVLFFKASFSCFDMNYYHLFILIKYDYSNVFFISDGFFTFLLIQIVTGALSLYIYIILFKLCFCAVFTS